MLERELKRYAAYFRGWCQAFGEHENVHSDASGIDWLLAGSQVGLVLPRPMIRPLYREVLLHEQPPAVAFRADHIEVGSLHIPLEEQVESAALDAIGELMQGEGDIHLYLTSHLLYGGGNRIITFSAKKPLLIIYKEIGRMALRLDR